MKSLGHQHMRTVYHKGEFRLQVQVTPMGDLIIQRYDQSNWRVGLLQRLYLHKGARQVIGQGRVVKRDEEATTNPEGLNYPKAKCRSERRWTKRSVILP
ncbi:hypothetical protein BHM03_00002718 [Ensete ventricosum]|nr:hypothetical protein BHM03_00002718 [Ensete ventricosum]